MLMAGGGHHNGAWHVLELGADVLGNQRGMNPVLVEVCRQ